MPEKRTFFFSRAGADKWWAGLIASVVRDAGHEAIHEKEFPFGVSYIQSMREAAANSDCTILVSSPAYFESKHCVAELNTALARDPIGESGNILPVLVAPSQLRPDLHAQQVYKNRSLAKHWRPEENEAKTSSADFRAPQPQRTSRRPD